MAANTGFAGFTGHRQGNGDIAATEGLTSYSITTNNRGFIANYNLEIGKKYYWEVRAKSFGGTNDQLFIGVCLDTTDLTGNRGGGQVAGGGAYGYENYADGVYLSSASSSGSGAGQYRQADLPANIRVKVDRVNHTISWALNAGSFSSTYTIPSTGRLYPWLGSGGGTLTAEARANFGQDSTFSGDLTAQTNTDENGFGEFYYSVPSGFLACCNGNRSVSADIDPNLTDDNHPTKQFTVAQWTGNNSSQTVDIGFKPDLLFFKIPSTANSWTVLDTVRGGTAGSTKSLKLDGTDQESTGAYVALTGYVSNGFTLTSSSGSDFNTNGTVYNAYCWRANEGTNVTNDDGDTTASVSANPKAGFSICTYSGIGSSNGQSTVGHGLDSAPEIIVHKGRNTTAGWWAQSSLFTGPNYLVQLNSTAGQTEYTGYGNLVAPTSSVFYINGIDGIGGGSTNYVSYCWHSVPGYSSFGTYTGSGQQDGRYIDLGFRPKLVVCKKINEASTTYGWANFNTTHQTSNKATFSGGWFDTGAAWSGNYDIQILGSGFKHRNNNTNLDASGKTYLYMAWADVPAKYNNGF